MILYYHSRPPEDCKYFSVHVIKSTARCRLITKIDFFDSADFGDKLLSELMAYGTLNVYRTEE